MGRRPAADLARKSLDFLRLQARTIHDSVALPHTTDFGDPSLSTEGLWK
jgi:hypothetical protein